MKTVREWALEALVLCGGSTAREIRALAEKYPHPEVWQMAVQALQRAKPERSPIGYLNTALRTSAEGRELLAGFGQEPDRDREPPAPLASRVLRERHIRKLRDVLGRAELDPADPPRLSDTPTTRHDHSRPSQAEWDAWERDELGAAWATLRALQCARPDPSDREASDTWRRQYAEASLRYELATS